ncbi:hypothetical protein NB311A_12187 [Nitrobacter sp. Nb-311A]|uniref:hypothetical protein n=1 Tax=Nitrobacter sp. Nb-311A TaxID=314253 RepID=UPI00006852F5|nr:hypothetical protein [Nitrobacter sp. Nb-311A]EAQ34501.1 hypothetical protein NB311A_12187 [Nitrobacter sp. Nb-311A]
MPELGKYEALQKSIDDAWDIARRLDLELLKFLLEMAKLELYREIEAAINSSTAERPEKESPPCQTLQ